MPTEEQKQQGKEAEHETEQSKPRLDMENSKAESKTARERGEIETRQNGKLTKVWQPRIATNEHHERQFEQLQQVRIKLQKQTQEPRVN